MRRRTILATSIAAAAVGLLPRTGATSEEAAQPILDRLRSVRRDMHLPEMLPHPALAEMARLQVLQMHRLGFATHMGIDGCDPPARGVRAGYTGHILGEALAETWDGPCETVDLWLAHDETRAVLLDAAARDVGVSGARGDTGITRWDLVVGF